MKMKDANKVPNKLKRHLKSKHPFRQKLSSLQQFAGSERRTTRLRAGLCMEESDKERLLTSLYQIRLESSRASCKAQKKKKWNYAQVHSSDYTIRRTGNIPDEATFQVYIEISHWLLHKKFENYSSEQLISFEMN